MKPIKAIAFSASLLFLAGCSGAMNGVVQGTGERVNIEFEDSGLGFGQLKTTLPDGETFEGKFVEASSSGYFSGYTPAGYTSGTLSSSSGNIEGTLFGNKGSTMQCRFRAVDSMLGLGAVGNCLVSDGRVIAVQL
jgi:hypothetical protein